MSARVEIVIDELVLHGFADAERHAIGEALTLELQHLVAAGDPAQLAALKSVSNLRTGQVSLTQGAKPQAVGSQVAQAVHGGLTK